MPSLLARWMGSEHQEKGILLRRHPDSKNRHYIQDRRLGSRKARLLVAVSQKFMRIEAPDKTPREHGAVFTLTMGVCTPTRQRIPNDLATTVLKRLLAITFAHAVLMFMLDQLQRSTPSVPRSTLSGPFLEHLVVAG